MTPKLSGRENDHILPDVDPGCKKKKTQHLPFNSDSFCQRGVTAYVILFHLATMEPV